MKPNIPKLVAPTEIIDGRKPREKFVCSGNVGYPGGDIHWEVKYAGTENFTRILPFEENVETKSGECSKDMRKEFSFTPTAEYDGMELRCVIENEHALTNHQRLVSSYIVHVIPGKNRKRTCFDKSSAIGLFIHSPCYSR